MSWLKSLLIPFALFLWIGTIIMFTNYAQDLSEALDERKLEIICNYATDAAIAELVENSYDLDIDYSLTSYVDVDPEVALDTFVILFLKGYNMSNSEENIAEVRTVYIPVFCVAGYDGYYMATTQPIQTDTYVFDSDQTKVYNYDLIFAPKVPYTYESGSKTYALNLGLEYATLLDTSNVSSSSNTVSLSTRVTNPLSEEDTLSVINAQVSDALMYNVYQEMAGDVQGSILIPSTLGNVYSTMPIEGVTVFAYVANVPSRWNGTKVDAFGIGGAQVETVRYVGAYTENGKKYYQYVDKLIEHGKDVASLVENYYETTKEAAQAGYYFDYRYY